MKVVNHKYDLCRGTGCAMLLPDTVGPENPILCGGGNALGNARFQLANDYSVGA